MGICIGKQRMRAVLVLLFIGATLSVPSETKAFRPRESSVNIYCGTIAKISRDTQPKKIVSLEEALRQEKFEPEGLLGGELVNEKPPQEGYQYVTLTVKLHPESSIGRNDYSIRTGEGTYDCKGMKTSKDTFDPRLWQVSAGKTTLNKAVELLYEIPEDSEDVKLVLNYDVPAAKDTIELAESRETAQKAAAEEAAAEEEVKPAEEGEASEKTEAKDENGGEKPEGSSDKEAAGKDGDSQKDKTEKKTGAEPWKQDMNGYMSEEGQEEESGGEGDAESDMDEEDGSAAEEDTQDNEKTSEDAEQEEADKEQKEQDDQGEDGGGGAWY